MRLIIFTGKGGVGKTTVSVATAIRSADMGKKTLMMSACASESLSDVLGMEMDGTIVHVSDNLDAIRIDAVREVKERWAPVQEYLSELIASRGMDRMSPEEMIMFPGTEFLAAMSYVAEFEASGEYDVVVMDTTAVADTLRLLRIQDTFGRHAGFMHSLLRKSKGFGRGAIGKLVGIPMPSDGLIEMVEGLIRLMDTAAEIYENPDKTSVRLVVTNDELSLAEARRAYTQICFFNRSADAIVRNGAACGSTPVDPGMLAKDFFPLGVISADHVKGGVKGNDALLALGKELYSGSAPYDVFNKEKPLSFSSSGNEMVLTMRLPFVDKRDVELFKSDDDGILMRVGRMKNRIALPESFSGAEIAGAEMKDGLLKIKFRS